MKGDLAKAFSVTGAILAAAAMIHALRLTVWVWAVIAAVMERGM